MLGRLSVFVLISCVVVVQSLRVFVSAGWHGREYATVELALDVLARPHSNGIEWVGWHTVNPEGVELARNGTDRCNRVLPHTQVDPNRNFPPTGMCDANEFMDPIQEEDAGPYPFSEPETRALAEAMHRAMPLDVALFLHSGTVAFLTPLDACLSLRPKNHAQHMKLARGMARAYHATPDVPVGPSASVQYPARGTASDWAWRELRVPLVLTLETYGTDHPDCTKQFVPSDPNEYLERWSRVWDWMEQQSSWIQTKLVQNQP
jgi:predicted deacylase